MLGIMLQYVAKKKGEAGGPCAAEISQNFNGFRD
jgi:hypothetical protein